MMHRVLLAAALLVAGCASALRTPEVRYEPTPHDVVRTMLELAEARRNAEQAGAAARTTFLEQDLFSVDLREVNALMLFLSPGFNLKLRPKIERELARGARVVSHWHDMGDWQADQSVRMPSDGRLRPIYLWIIR